MLITFNLWFSDCLHVLRLHLVAVASAKPTNFGRQFAVQGDIVPLPKATSSTSYPALPQKGSGDQEITRVSKRAGLAFMVKRWSTLADRHPAYLKA
jgi:hypothetical protein